MIDGHGGQQAASHVRETLVGELLAQGDLSKNVVSKLRQGKCGFRSVSISLNIDLARLINTEDRPGIMPQTKLSLLKHISVTVSLFLVFDRVDKSFLANANNSSGAACLLALI